MARLSSGISTGAALHAAAAGTRSMASRAANEALERLAPVNVAVSRRAPPFHLAESFIVAGDLDRGLELLERSRRASIPATWRSTAGSWIRCGTCRGSRPCWREAKEAGSGTTLKVTLSTASVR